MDKSVNITKQDLKDLPALLKKGGFVDEEEIWVAGYLNFRNDYNAVVGSLLTGKKKLRFLAKNGEEFYLLKIVDSVLSVYKTFSKKDVASIVTGRKILSISLEIEFKDEDKFGIDVTQNKDKVKKLKSLLK